MAIISDDDNKQIKIKNEDTTSSQTTYDMSFENNIRPKKFEEYGN